MPPETTNPFVFFLAAAICGGYFLWRRNKVWQRKLEETENLLSDANASLKDLRIAADKFDGNGGPFQALAEQFDSETGLPAWNSFTDRIREQLKSSTAEDNTTSALIFLKIENFRTVRDGLGPEDAGLLLNGLGQVLPKVFGARSTYGRFRDDTFGVLVKGIRNPDQAAEKGAEFRDYLAAGISLEGKSSKVGLTTTLGVAPWTPQYQNENAWIADAEAALGEAQSLGAGRLSFYSNTMHMRSIDRWRMEGELREALDQEQLQMHFQPIVHFPDGTPAGFEALIRWVHPSRGFISPADFIPIAEQAGMICAIGDLALRQSCAALAVYREKFPQLDLFMSVNFSPLQLDETGFLSTVQSLLKDCEIPAASLKLEITETAMASEADKMKELLAELHAIGVKLSLDDFGTGYSSMAYLDSFPISTLKIDRSFVAEVDRDAAKKEIVGAILLLAQSLNLDVIGEGIETKSQRQVLEQMGCKFGQGWLFSKALPPDQIPAWIDENRTHS